MKWLHKLLKGASLATALFIFQACYGMPMDLSEIGLFSFVVIDEDSGEPLEGIEVYRQDGVVGPYVTDESGCTPYFFYECDAIWDSGVTFSLRSPDNAYFKKDTTFIKIPDEHVVVKLKKAAE